MAKRLFPAEYPEEQSKKFRSYRRFLKGIDTEATRVAYTKHLFNFMKFHNLTDYDKVASLDINQIDILVEDYIDSIESRETKGKTVKTSIAGVELFLLMNDCIWHNKRIKKEIKKDKEIPGGQNPITTPEVKRMIDVTNSLRTKALVLFLASTGIRPGALVDPVLKIKHLVEMPHPTDKSITKYCYGIKVYDESLEGYWVFLTPETVKAFDAYFEWRKLNGENLDNERPIFGIVDNRSAKNEHMTDKNVRYRLEELIDKAAVKRVKVSKYRYDKAIVYMFRKRFNTILKLENSVNSNIAEKLMAHKKGLDGVYLQPTREECYTEFVKAIPELSINQENKKEAIIQEQEIRLEKYSKQDKRIEEVEKENMELKQSLTRSEEFESKIEERMAKLERKSERREQTKKTIKMKLKSK